MNRLLLAFAALAALAMPASAQQGGPPRVVSLCGSMSPFSSQSVGGQGALTVDANGLNCGNSSATVSGGFTATQALGRLAVTDVTNSATISTGSTPVVVATNVDAANGAYCQLGASGTNGGQYIAPGGGWFAFQRGSATQLSCIADTGLTATVVLWGGSGLPTGTGGGGGGGGGGNVVITGPLGAQTAAASVAVTEYTAGNLIDMGAYNAITPYTGSGSMNLLNGIAGLYAAAVNAPNVNVGSTPTPVQGKTVGTETSMSVDLNSMGGTALTQDPCFNNFANIVSKPINLTASGVIITHSSTKKTYICHIHVVASTNENVALVEGTGTVCATNIFGLAGGTTAATGWNLTSNGIAIGNGGATVVSGDKASDGNAAGADICLIASAAAQLSGTITAVLQ